MPGYLQAFMKAGVLCVCCSPVGRVASCADPRHPLPRRRKHDNVQGIVHPLVSAARDEWVAARHAEGVRLAVLGGGNYTRGSGAGSGATGGADYVLMADE